MNPVRYPYVLQRVTQKRKFLNLALPNFHIFVTGNRRHFKFGMWVEHSYSPAYGRQTVTERGLVVASLTSGK